MKTEITIPNTEYVVTAMSTPLDVWAVRDDGGEVLLLTADKPGQYGVLAISSRMTFSEDDAVLTGLPGSFSYALSGASSGGGEMPGDAALVDANNTMTGSNVFNGTLTANGAVNLNGVVSMPNVTPAAAAPVTEATLFDYLIERDMIMADLRDERQVSNWPGKFTTPLEQGHTAAFTYTGRDHYLSSVGLLYSGTTAVGVSGRWESNTAIVYPSQNNGLVAGYDEGCVMFTAPKLMSLSQTTDGDYVALALVNATDVIGIRMINRGGTLYREVYTSDIDGGNEVVHGSIAERNGYYGFSSVSFARLYARGGAWTVRTRDWTVDCGPRPTIFWNRKLRLEMSLTPKTASAFGGGRGVWAQTCITYGIPTRNAPPVPSTTNKQFWGLS